MDTETTSLDYMQAEIVAADAQGVPRAARFTFDDLCIQPLGPQDFLAIADQQLAKEALKNFKKLGLDAHLTPQRSNGLRAMVERIKADLEARGHRVWMDTEQIKTVKDAVEYIKSHAPNAS